MYVCRHVCMYVCRYAWEYLCRYGYNDICIQMYMVCTCIYVSMHMFGTNKRERGERHQDVGWQSAGWVFWSPFWPSVCHQFPCNQACTPRSHALANAPTSPTPACCAERRWVARSVAGHIPSGSMALRELRHAFSSRALSLVWICELILTWTNPNPLYVSWGNLQSGTINNAT